MWVALVAGLGLVVCVALGVILPFTKKGEWMGFVLLAYVVLLLFMLLSPKIG